MKQQVTRFQKSTPRLLAYLFIGLTLIGFALFLGGDTLGFVADGLASWLMVLGAVGATVFLLVMGATPIPVGTSHVEMEDRVQVKMSDELSTDIQASINDAVKEIKSQNRKKLDELNEQAASLVEEQKKKLDNIASNASSVSNNVDGLKSEINRIQDQLSDMDVGKLASDLQKLNSAIDIQGASDAIDELKGSVNSITGGLDNLENLSTKKAEELENTLNEISENLQSLVSSMQQTDREVNKTLRQFQEFNTGG